MNEHSPVPWTADETGSVIVASNGNVIAVLPGVPMLKPSETDKANMKHIETAINAYDALLEAVTLSAATFEHGRPGVAEKAHQACRKALMAVYFPEMKP
jgi:hypothetical protein